MGRPLLEPIKEQQQMIETLQGQVTSLLRHVAVQDAQITYISGLAGVSKAVAAIKTYADIENPGQPVPDPPDQAPSETTEQAATPEAYDDVRRPGLTPGSVQHVPAETTTVALEPGVSLPTTPYNDLQDVTAPVNGTETHVPNDQTRIETDVRVGDPMNPEIAFPWGMGANNSNGGRTSGARLMSAIRLARLQIAAGIADGDDLVVAASIAEGDISDEKIATQIETLGAVHKAASRGHGRPGNLVPRAASQVGQVQRVAPSLASDEGVHHTASTVADDTADSDIFD